jgi:hypothetical protein
LTSETQTQDPVKALGDLKKVTAFIALYLRQYITNGFDKKDYFVTKNTTQVVKKFTLGKVKKIVKCMTLKSLRPYTPCES